jgi:hypothetical protein
VVGSSPNSTVSETYVNGSAYRLAPTLAIARA